MKLSATVITLNEEKDLPRLFSSVKNLADEIVVVDSGSTDKTLTIAERFGCITFKRKFDNYSNQKNYALEKASGDWILSLDADEEVTPELAQEIKRAIKDGSYDGYSIPRKNIILGKFIKHTRWDPELDRHVWLWRKGKGKWVGSVHEEVVVSGKVGKLKNAKIHYQYKTVREFIDMINRYTNLEAEEMIKKGIRFSYFRFFYDPVYEFLVRFVYRKGFLDNWQGFALSYLMAIYKMTTWVKVWERNK